MLLASALCQLLRIYDDGSLSDLAASVKVDTPIILVQILGRTLCRQLGDGSWGHSVEENSYGVLLISYVLELPWSLPVRRVAEVAFSNAKRYLESHSTQWAISEYLWIEKVTYKLPTLSEAYRLAAMRSSIKEPSWSSGVKQLLGLADTKVQRMTMFFSNLPLLQNLSQVTMTFAIHEAAMYTSRLRQVRLTVFPRDDMDMSADKYLEYIPIAWTTINAANNFKLSGVEMWEMMVLSMLNYQADEYMESCVAHLIEASTQTLGMIIGAEIGNGGPRYAPYFPPHPAITQPTNLTPPRSDSGSPPRSRLTDVVEVLSKFIRHIKRHTALLRSPESAQLRVMQELEKFLLAHIAHNADNTRFQEQLQARFHLPVCKQDSPHYDWVRTTGANDTSCPFSFAFFCCLISGNGPHCLSSMERRYIAREFCLHLATLCQQYNDYGSAMRDQEEGNLNSLHFVEFRNDGE